MNKTLRSLLLLALPLLAACSNSPKELQAPPFPYQHILDSDSEDNYSYNIGDDGDGFAPISHNIRYPQAPANLSPIADSLLQYYNVVLAFNTIAYDVSTAERYMSDSLFSMPAYADALAQINLEGISHQKIAGLLKATSDEAAQFIRKGVEPNSQEANAVKAFYDEYYLLFGNLLNSNFVDDEFNPATVLENYDEIHATAISDTTSACRRELLQRLLSEEDFGRKCVLAREFVYANYISPEGDSKELVAVIHPLLEANEYSPLLGELWRVWRLTLQGDILGGNSNDSAMYNLLYNNMRNRVALTYIAHLNANPNDLIAFKEFIRLTQTLNIVRNSSCLFGNNTILEKMKLIYSVVKDAQE